MWQDFFDLDGIIRQKVMQDKFSTIPKHWDWVLLCDCNDFTKTYYRTKYGIENFTSIPCKAPSPPKIERKFPPYTGFGSEEDSLRSCIGLMPIPHQRNFKKFIEFDSYGNISNTLRFFAKLITHKCADVERMFVISYFLSDDTISVFEPIERNSGKRHTTHSNFLRTVNCLFMLKVMEYNLIFIA